MKAASLIATLAFSSLVIILSLEASAQTNAAKAFEQINSDLRVKSKTVSPYEYVDAVERSMLDFIKRYPKAPETAQAHFALGRIYSTTGAHESAIRHFDEYLKAPGDKGGLAVVAQAKLVMGSSYMALERYDEAERLFKEVAGAGGSVDSRITQGASAEMGRIATLRKLKVGAPAMEIAATSQQGKKINLKAYRGRVVLIDFWAAWCNPCRQEMPNVIKTYNEFGKKGFEIIGVSLDNDKAQFESFVKENRMPWPQIFDGKGWQSAIARTYAVNSIPATFLIDKKGNIRFKNVRGEKLRTAVQQLLNEK